MTNGAFLQIQIKLDNAFQFQMGITFVRVLYGFRVIYYNLLFKVRNEEL